MAEEQDIKQETVDETVETTNVETPAVEEAEEVVADAAQVLEELKADFDNAISVYKRTSTTSNVVLIKKKSNLQDMLKGMYLQIYFLY